MSSSLTTFTSVLSGTINPPDRRSCGIVTVIPTASAEEEDMFLVKQSTQTIDDLDVCVPLQATEEQQVERPRSGRQSTGRFLLESKSLSSFKEIFSLFDSKSKRKLADASYISSNSNSNNNSVNEKMSEAGATMSNVQLSDAQSPLTEPVEQKRLSGSLNTCKVSSFPSFDEKYDAIKTEELKDVPSVQEVVFPSAISMTTVKEAPLGEPVTMLGKDDITFMVLGDETGHHLKITSYGGPQGNKKQKKCPRALREKNASMMLDVNLIETTNPNLLDVMPDNSADDNTNDNDCVSEKVEYYYYRAYASKVRGGDTPSYLTPSSRRRNVSFTDNTVFFHGDYNKIGR